jgi:hypothetical protein
MYTTPIPTPERKPTWRAACLAYREKLRACATDAEGSDAEAINAVAYASTHHTEWFWRGVGG